MLADHAHLGSTCNVLLTTLPFEESSEAVMRPLPTVQRLSYTFGGSVNTLQAPYIITYWDTDTVYLCLPSLSCNPKLVRFRLSNIHPQQASSAGEETPIQTLVSPIFLPSSTPYRKPKLLYRASPERSDILVLALDSLRQSDSDGGNDYPPTVMEWKIDNMGGWRAWEDIGDGEEHGLRGMNRTYETLRGTFITADQGFNVVVRSGLNWTKKAFLSCA